MSDFGYDPELPSGFQDADLEMAQLTESANRTARMRKRGICDHGWIQGPPGRPDAPRTDWLCHHCGATFATEAMLEDAREQAREAML